MRNVKPLWSKLGLTASMTLGGFDMWMATLTGWNPVGDLRHGKTDSEATEPAESHKPIDYPKPDGKLSFDRLNNVSFSGTAHEEGQPCHLHLIDLKSADIGKPAQVCGTGRAILPRRCLRSAV